MWGRRPSTPFAVVRRPRLAARFSPSDAGSIPTSQTGSIHSLRSALMTRSGPMFPEPMIAALIFFIASSSGSYEADRRGAHPPNEHPHLVTGLHWLERYERARKNDLPPAQRRTQPA